MQRLLPRVVFLLASAVPGSADLLFYEAFDYPSGTDALGNVGGYTATFQDSLGDVLPGSLRYTDAKGNVLVTSGNRAQLDGIANVNQVTHSMPFNLEAASGDALWFTLVGRQTGGQAGRFVNVSIRTDDDSVEPPDAGKAEDELIAIGLPATLLSGAPFWGVTDRSGTYRQTALSEVSTYEQAFLVARVELNYDGALERVSFWVNPTLDETPSDAAARQFVSTYSDLPDWAAILAIRLQAAQGYAWELDEIRIGDTWEDVAPYFPGPKIATWEKLPSGAVRLFWLPLAGHEDVVEWSTDLRTWSPFGGSRHVGEPGEGVRQFDAAPPSGGGETFYVRIARAP